MRSPSRALCTALDGAGDPERAEHLQRFFRTGPGEYGVEYGEGDRFPELRVPEVRAIARRHRELSLADVLASAWHEHRQHVHAIITPYESTDQTIRIPARCSAIR